MKAEVLKNQDSIIKDLEEMVRKSRSGLNIERLIAFFKKVFIYMVDPKYIRACYTESILFSFLKVYNIPTLCFEDELKKIGRRIRRLMKISILPYLTNICHSILPENLEIQPISPVDIIYKDQAIIQPILERRMFISGINDLALRIYLHFDEWRHELAYLLTAPILPKRTICCKYANMIIESIPVIHSDPLYIAQLNSFISEKEVMKFSFLHKENEYYLLQEGFL